jgi:hypothetical protein
MIYLKVLALSLLFSGPYSYARIQLHTKADFCDSARFGDHHCDTTCQLNIHEPIDVYTHDIVKMVAELLSEGPESCVVHFDCYAKNPAGQYEKIDQHVLAINYTDPAKISRRQIDGEGNPSECFTLTARAFHI